MICINREIGFIMSDLSVFCTFLATAPHYRTDCIVWDHCQRWRNVQDGKSNVRCAILNVHSATLNVQCATLNVECARLNVRCGKLNDECASLNVEYGKLNVQSASLNDECAIFNNPSAGLNVERAIRKDETTPLPHDFYLVVSLNKWLGHALQTHASGVTLNP